MEKDFLLYRHVASLSKSHSERGGVNDGSILAVLAFSVVNVRVHKTKVRVPGCFTQVDIV
jgi:hypothetical protein